MTKQGQTPQGNKSKGKDQAGKGVDPATSQTNIVSKILKTKNKFRAGLGFKENRQLGDEHKAKVNQAVTMKKIIQGTKADRTNRQDDDEANQNGENYTKEIETGTKNHNKLDDIEEETTMSKAALKTKKIYTDPRAIFMQELAKQEKEKSKAEDKNQNNAED